MSKKETILITGGSGLVGRHLSGILMRKGYDVLWLSTRAGYSSGYPVRYWDIKKGIIDREAITSASFIIHLAGAGIGDRKWTDKRKREILDSRIQGTQLIFNTIKENRNNLKAFISASATGYYGTITSEKIFTEDDPPADDFTGLVCRQWEEAADNFESLGIRTVKIRTGIVLSKEGGALAGMLTAFKYRMNVVPGKGDQYLPWIHINDLCEVYIRAIGDESMNGAWNAVAPDFTTMEKCMDTIAQTGIKPLVKIHIPAALIKLVKGEMAGLLLRGSRIAPARLAERGFKYRFPELKKAMEDLIKA